MTTKHDCSKEVPEGGRSISFYPCQRPATVKHNGKWYCWQHDPERVKTEAKKRRAAQDAKMDREDAKYKRIARNAKLGALMTVEVAELLEALANAIDKYRALGFSQITYSARKLAAQIREACL